MMDADNKQLLLSLTPLPPLLQIKYNTVTQQNETTQQKKTRWKVQPLLKGRLFYFGIMREMKVLFDEK